MKPLLKWAGGKRWLVPEIKRMWEAHDAQHLFEVFAGGAAVAFGIEPKFASIVDTNKHLINFYIQVQLGNLVLPGTWFVNDGAHYYWARDTFNALATNGGHQTPLAAALFYYLNRTGFNGLCRFNQSGEFNVPFGKRRWISHVKDFTKHCEIMRSWIIVARDFELDIIGDGRSLIYADPPYDHENGENGFTKYGGWAFTWDDQVRLAEWLAKQTRPAVASNRATDRILELYQDHGFHVHTMEVGRRISRDPKTRKPVLEMVATNFEWEWDE